MVERAIATMPSNPIVVRLSGYAQHNDRLAIREIAWQLAQQTGTSFLPSDADEDEDGEPTNPTEAAEAVTKEHEKEQDEDTEGEADEDENPFVDHPSAPAPRAAEPVIALPPPAHLLALISMIPTLPRPTIIVLDGFDLFAGHARQALLYCLLDTAQSCRAGMVSGTGSGMAVVGVTARVDTINLLEKRVKSRFSGRMIRTACPAKLGHWVELAKGVLGAPVGDEMEDEDVVRTESGREWEKMWKVAVEKFAEDEEVVEMLRETYALARDFQIFRRIMVSDILIPMDSDSDMFIQTGLALELTPASPFPTRARLESSVSRQRCPPRYPSLNSTSLSPCPLALPHPNPFFMQLFRTPPCASLSRRCTHRHQATTSSRSRCSTTHSRPNYAHRSRPPYTSRAGASGWSAAAVRCSSRYVAHSHFRWVYRSYIGFSPPSMEWRD